MTRYALLALVAGLGWGCTMESNAKTGRPAERPPGEAWITRDQLAKSVQVQTAELRSLKSRVVSNGRVAFDDTKVAHVFSPVTGRVEKLVAGIGDVVKAQGPLCLIDSPDVGNAGSDLAKAAADLQAAEHDLRRKQDLAAVHAGTQSDLEQSRDNYGRAKAEMERASLKMNMWHITKANAVSQSFTLRSPIAGTVLMRNANPGIEVQGIYSGANIANELFTVGDTSSVWVYIDLYEVDLAKVKRGQDVAFTSVSYPGEVFTGKVSLVTEVIDPTTRTARVRCDIENPERKLKPEMYVTASIYTGSREALTVPRRSIVRLADQAIVFAQVSPEIAPPAESRPDGATIVRFKAVPVRVGDEDGEYAEIVGGGLKAGDPIVTRGAVLVSGAL